MPFAKGKSGNVKGRPKGALNVLTTTIREGVLETFHTLQSTPGHTLLDFALEYPRDFWPLAGKLIPTEIKADVNSTHEIQIAIIPADYPDQESDTNEGDESILSESSGL